MSDDDVAVRDDDVALRDDPDLIIRTPFYRSSHTTLGHSENGG